MLSLQLSFGLLFSLNPLSGPPVSHFFYTDALATMAIIKLGVGPASCSGTANISRTSSGSSYSMGGKLVLLQGCVLQFWGSGWISVLLLSYGFLYKGFEVVTLIWFISWVWAPFESISKWNARVYTWVLLEQLRASRQGMILHEIIVGTHSIVASSAATYWVCWCPTSLWAANENRITELDLVVFSFSWVGHFIHGFEL